MIDEAATFERFGYHSYDLMPMSGKKIIAVCDDCGMSRELCKSQYRAFCRSCTRRGKRHPNYGKKRSKDFITKISGENNSFYGKTHSETSLERMRAAKTGENNPRWLGGISFRKYCYRFNESCKEHNREKHGRVCFVCGMTEEENGKKLSVHHVDYDKQQGCGGKEWVLVPLCHSCHSKTNIDRKYWNAYLCGLMDGIQTDNWRQSTLVEFNEVDNDKQ